MARVTAAVRTTFRSLRYRNYRLFFTGQLVSQAGTWLTMIALVLLVLHRTDKSGLAIGILTACQFAPILVLGAFGGLVADRYDKRRLLLVTQTLEMLQSFGLAALAFIPGTPLIAFYLMALAGGTMLAFDNPARRSFVSEMTPTGDLQNAVTLNSALMTSSRVIGPAIAGVLVVTVGFGWCFTIDAISYLAVLRALFMMRPAELRAIPITPRGKGQVREGIRYVRNVPELWISFVMLAVIGTLSYNFTVVFPLFVLHGLHGGDAAYTLVYSVFSAGSLVGALAVAHRISISVRHVVIGATAFGVTMLGLSISPSVGATYPIVVVLGVSSIMYMTATTALVQVRANPMMHGRVLALQSVLLIGTTPVGGPILGAMADTFGARSPVVLGGIAALAAAAWGAAVGRHVLSRPGLPAEGDVTADEAPFA